MAVKQDIVWGLFVKHYIIKFTQTRGHFIFKKTCSNLGILWLVIHMHRNQHGHYLFFAMLSYYCFHLHSPDK